MWKGLFGDRQSGSVCSHNRAKTCQRSEPAYTLCAKTAAERPPARPSFDSSHRGGPTRKGDVQLIFSPSRSQFDTAPAGAAGLAIHRHLDLLPEAGEDRHQPMMVTRSSLALQMREKSTAATPVTSDGLRGCHAALSDTAATGATS
jgi:hypothetical protein